jgi:hypothetical protein
MPCNGRRRRLGLDLNLRFWLPGRFGDVGGLGNRRDD